MVMTNGAYQTFLTCKMLGIFWFKNEKMVFKLTGLVSYNLQDHLFQ